MPSSIKAAQDLRGVRLLPITQAHTHRIRSIFSSAIQHSPDPTQASSAKLDPRMHNDRMTKKECERQLLAHIDVPYFRNNPSYIELWRRYYNSQRDPQILLLMYHKHISTYYHWIYIELAKHFVRVKEPELAHFILSEALQDGVYDPERLREALSRIPAFDKKYKRGSMLCILNQKNICALGAVWNKYEERSYCDMHLDASHSSFEMLRTKQYLAQRGIEPASRGIDAAPVATVSHGGGSAFWQTVFFTECARGRGSPENKENAQVDNRPQNQSAGTADELCSAPALQQDGHMNGPPADAGTREVAGCEPAPSGYPDEDGGKLSESQATGNEAAGDCAGCSDTATDRDLGYLLERRATVHKITEDLETEHELVIGEFVHILQENGPGYYISMRVASDADVTQTVAGRTYCMKRITHEQALLLVRAREYEFCTACGVLYVLFELDRLGALPQILTYCDEITCLHYLAQTLGMVREFADVGVCISNLELCVDTNFNIVLTDFSLVPLDPDAAHRTAVQIGQIFSGFKVEHTAGLNAPEEELGAKLSTPDFKRALLRHKTTVLNDL